MTRVEIIEAFRAECPEITDRVVADAVLHDWLLQGDKEICAITRCIQGEGLLASVATTSVYDTKYDLTALISKYYAIDDTPGGGVVFDDDPLDKTTMSELDRSNSTWRSRSAGTPKKWFTRGSYLYFDYPVETADLDIRVYCSLVSDDFNDDALEPYNGLTYLEPFHGGLIKYLIWKAKAKVGKPAEAVQTKQEFYDYANWMKKEIGGNKFGKIYLQPKAGYAK